MQPWGRGSLARRSRSKGRRRVGGLLLRRPGRRAGVGLACPSPPPPPIPPPSCRPGRLPSCRGPVARLCTFHPWPAGLGRGAAARAAGAVRSCPGTGAASAPPAPRGSACLRLGPRPAPARAENLGAALAAASRGTASPRRGRDPGPHKVPREAKDLGSVSRQLGKELALKFRGGFSFLVGKPLLVRVQRAVPGVRGRREFRWTSNPSGRASHSCLLGRLFFVSSFSVFLSSICLTYLTFL